MKIKFTACYQSPSGLTINGLLDVIGPHDKHEHSFLGELNDVHPEFAAELVKSFNTYQVIKKILAIEGPDGNLARALKEHLT